MSTDDEAVQEAFLATIESAAKACRAHAALLEQRLDAIKAGQVFTSKDIESCISSSKAHHYEQISSWNCLSTRANSLGGATRCAASLDGLRYTQLPKDTLFALRPHPPCKNLRMPDQDTTRSRKTAAEDYQDMRSHLKQAMKMNPLVGEMQVTVSRRMHAVPALGSVPLPKNTAGASHLAGTASQAAREMMTSQIDSAAPLQSSRQQAPIIPSGSSEISGGNQSDALPWQAELRARQQQASTGMLRQSEVGSASSSSRHSMPPQVAPGMQSELEAALERRRKSAAQ